MAWTGAPLPAAATDDTAWHLGLVASSGTTAVLADNIAGQPYVLVRHSGTWYQPSQEGGFGYPLATATPTSLVSDNGTLVMSVELAQPGARLGEGTSSVTVLVTSNGRSWRTASKNAFDDSTVNQLLPVPTGLLAVGAAPLPVHATGSASWTGAFASLSPNEGVTWPNEPISPETLGGPGSATSAQAASDAGVADASVGGGNGSGGSGTTGLAGAQVEAGAGTRGGAGAGAGTPGSGGGSATSPSVNEPLAATAAGRLGDSEYVVGQAGPQAVGWFSPDGNAWEAPQPLDTSPQLGTEQPRATCWTGNSAVVVGSVTTTGPGSLPAAWVSSDGSSWTSSTFDPASPAGSSSTVDGCLSTGNSFIAYGGSTGSGVAEQPVVWTSSDGTVWQQSKASFTGADGNAPVGPEVAPLDGIALGTTTWLGLSGSDDSPSEQWPAPVGGAAGEEFTPAGLWSSVDAGGSWQQIDTAVPAFNGELYSQADVAAYVGEQPVVAGTVDGQLAIWIGTPVATARKA